MSDAWSLRCLPKELAALSRIRDRGAAKEPDPALRSRVQEQLRAAAVDDPQRLHVMQMKQREDNLPVFWRTAADVDGPWPVSPKVVFESALGAAIDLGELTPYRDDLNEEAVNAWLKWRKHPQAEKADLARQFQEGSEQCIAVLRQKYIALQDANCVPYLLEVVLSNSDGHLDEQAALRQLETALAEAKVLQAEYDAIEPRDPLGQESRSLEQEIFSRQAPELRTKLASAAVASTCEAPSLSAYERFMKPLVHRYHELDAEKFHARQEDFHAAAVPTSTESFSLQGDLSKACGDEAREEVFTLDVREALSTLVSPFIQWQLMREHAMLALIPLLPLLTGPQARWLVYACCSTRAFPERDSPLTKSLDPLITFEDVLFNARQKVFEEFPDEAEPLWDVADRIFACGLPDNILQAMCTFAMDETVPSPNSDGDGGQRVRTVQRFLARHATENPAGAHIARTTLCSMLEKVQQLADPSAHTDPAKVQRLQAFGGRPVDLDFLNRGELAMLIEAVIDCEASNCIKAVRQLYTVVSPNHSIAAYGKHGLLAVLYIMGIADKLTPADVATAAQRQSISISGDDVLGMGSSSTADIIAQMAIHAAETQTVPLANAISGSGESELTLMSAQCANCGAKTSTMKRCGQCKLVKYCSAECQRTDWSSHKKRCNLAGA